MRNYHPLPGDDDDVDSTGGAKEGDNISMYDLSVISKISYSTTYTRDNEGLDFSGQKYHSKPSLTIPSWHLGSIF